MSRKTSGGAFKPTFPRLNMIGVSRQTISFIATGHFNPSAKLALILCIALDKKFETCFIFNWGYRNRELINNKGIPYFAERTDLMESFCYLSTCFFPA